MSQPLISRDRGKVLWWSQITDIGGIYNVPVCAHVCTRECMYLCPLHSPSKTTRIDFTPHLAEVWGGESGENMKISNEVRVDHSFGLAIGMRCLCLGWHQGIKGRCVESQGRQSAKEKLLSITEMARAQQLRSCWGW